jgi:hypothetical protein
MPCAQSQALPGGVWCIRYALHDHETQLALTSCSLHCMQLPHLQGPADPPVPSEQCHDSSNHPVKQPCRNPYVDNCS